MQRELCRLLPCWTLPVEARVLQVSAFRIGRFLTGGLKGLRREVHPAQEVLKTRVGAEVKQAGPVASPSPLNGLICAEVGQLPFIPILVWCYTSETVTPAVVVALVILHPFECGDENYAGGGIGRSVLQRLETKDRHEATTPAF